MIFIIIMVQDNATFWVEQKSWTTDKTEISFLLHNSVNWFESEQWTVSGRGEDVGVWKEFQ